MPGAYTGEYLIIRAPVDGEHVTKKDQEERVRKGDLVYLHPEHKARFGTLLITYPHNSSEGRPYLELELVE